MKVNGKHYRSIWVDPQEDTCIKIIDQRWLPHEFRVEDIRTVDQMVTAIKDMHLRGAGLIGAAGGYGMYLAVLESQANGYDQSKIKISAEKLQNTRPTATNLSWAINRQMQSLRKAKSGPEMLSNAFALANQIANEDASNCLNIGRAGLQLIGDISAKKKGERVNVLTHCNAGWLAFVDYGSALSPIYAAFDNGIDVHVWVDETRPRNQGARLTAWELAQHGVPHTIIVDNAGGHLMQHGQVDIVITGSDRTTMTGDVANKIGTYLKALAAKDNNIPFYVALPSSTIDWAISDGLSEIVIEERNQHEVKYIYGLYKNKVVDVLLTSINSQAANIAFDVTPSKLVTGLITERGICAATKEGILGLFPEKE